MGPVTYGTVLPPPKVSCDAHGKAIGRTSALGRPSCPLTAVLDLIFRVVVTTTPD